MRSFQLVHSHCWDKIWNPLTDIVLDRVAIVRIPEIVKGCLVPWRLLLYTQSPLSPLIELSALSALHLSFRTRQSSPSCASAAMFTPYESRSRSAFASNVSKICEIF